MNHTPVGISRSLGVAFAAFILSTAFDPRPASADVPSCDLDRPIVFAGLDYDSAAFHTAVAMHILKEGYGCTVDSIPGSTLPLLQGLVRGDVDLVMEVWTANPAPVWQAGLDAGAVVSLGTTFPDAEEGWWVPRYLVEGEGAKAAGLRSVSDLPRFKDVFADPEEPGKGRFYNCVAGWVCEFVNTKKLAVYGLDDDYTNFRPGTGAALSAAAESAYLRRQPILFYNWTPTWLMGKYDFVRLEEPPFDRPTWDAFMESDNPTAATAYPQSSVIVSANKAFSESAPTVTAFLTKYGTTSALTSEALAYMQDEKASAEDAALRFLAGHPEVWTSWVPTEVAARVKAALSR